MKIEKRWTVKFKTVRNGQVFEYLGGVYMRVAIVDDVGRFICNAVNLENCNYTILVDDMQVTLYENAKVVLI